MRGATIAADLANTSPRVWTDDKLGDLSALRRFLAERDIPTEDLTQDDLQHVRRLREDLTQVFLATDEQAAVDLLNRLVAEAGVRPRLVRDADGWHWSLSPAGDARSVAHLTASSAIGLLTLVARDGLDRLGTCAAHGCVGLYVDLTRNRSRRYCMPEICGNRTNLAAFRARRRAERSP